MKVRYNRKHDILYIDLNPEEKAHNTQPLNDDVFIDLDENNNIHRIFEAHCNRLLDSMNINKFLVIQLV